MCATWAARVLLHGKHATAVLLAEERHRPSASTLWPSYVLTAVLSVAVYRSGRKVWKRVWVCRKAGGDRGSAVEPHAAAQSPLLLPADSSVSIRRVSDASADSVSIHGGSTESPLGELHLTSEVCVCVCVVRRCSAAVFDTMRTVSCCGRIPDG
jgi:hypothetical protein